MISRHPAGGVAARWRVIMINRYTQHTSLMDIHSSVELSASWELRKSLMSPTNSATNSETIV